jgi:DMSO reductase anchor subunit
MHPAYSVIVFTTASGAGYGLMMLLALFGLLGLVPISLGLGLAGIGGAMALISAGLLSSTAHLGRPERAWRAFSQWRSSWLSREGVVAVAAFVPIGFVFVGWVFFGSLSGLFAFSASASIVLTLGTVWCTGMIYASLPTIRAWHLPIVPAIYLVLALATGAVLLHLTLALSGVSSAAAAVTAIAALLVSGALKLIYWSTIDHLPKTYTIGSATGLGRFGTVRPLESAHTQANYVMREMGYQIGRKHARKLRRIALALLVLFPVLCLALSLLGGAAAAPLDIVAALSASVGVVIERWLFFAEAQHVAMLYYGAVAV